MMPPLLRFLTLTLMMTFLRLAVHLRELCIEMRDDGGGVKRGNLSFVLMVVLLIKTIVEREGGTLIKIMDIVSRRPN